jgi:hypothetical protein
MEKIRKELKSIQTTSPAKASKAHKLGVTFFLASYTAQQIFVR